MEMIDTKMQFLFTVLHYQRAARKRLGATPEQPASEHKGEKQFGHMDSIAKLVRAVEQAGEYISQLNLPKFLPPCNQSLVDATDKTTSDFVQTLERAQCAAKPIDVRRLRKQQLSTVLLADQRMFELETETVRDREVRKRMNMAHWTSLS